MSQSSCWHKSATERLDENENNQKALRAIS